MKWLRSVLAHFPLRAAPTRAERELEDTRPKHHATLKRADRVIEEYRKLDGVLQVYVRRRGH